MRKKLRFYRPTPQVDRTNKLINHEPLTNNDIMGKLKRHHIMWCPWKGGKL